MPELHQLYPRRNPISEFEYQGIHENPYIQDHRIWEFSKSEDTGIIKFLIQGRFCRDVTINTYPKGADIYVDGDLTAAGITNDKPIHLTLGMHMILLKKERYLDKKLSFLTIIGQTVAYILLFIFFA